MIRINDLHFSYPGSCHRVFDGLNLSLESDSIYGLLGKNGEGKSTLLYLLSGLLRAPRGEVKFLGMDMKERRAEALQEIFIVPEEYDLPRMTMKQFIELNRRFYPRFSEEVLRGCLRDFEMPEVVDLKSLSMGQKKKVYMSFALAANTRLLLMDEPTNGLDIPSKSLFRKAVANSMCGTASSSSPPTRCTMWRRCSTTFSFSTRGISSLTVPRLPSRRNTVSSAASLPR